MITTANATSRPRTSSSKLLPPKPAVRSHPKFGSAVELLSYLELSGGQELVTYTQAATLDGAPDSSIELMSIALAVRESVPELEYLRDAEPFSIVEGRAVVAAILYYGQKLIADAMKLSGLLSEEAVQLFSSEPRELGKMTADQTLSGREQTVLEFCIDALAELKKTHLYLETLFKLQTGLPHKFGQEFKRQIAVRKIVHLEMWQHACVENASK